MPLQLIHSEFGYTHKYINCSGKPFSQISTASVVPLCQPECSVAEASTSQLFFNSVIKGSIHSSIFTTVALFDISVDIE